MQKYPAKLRQTNNVTLEDFFQLNPRVTIAFSGGIDSAFLLHQACKYAKSVHAVFVKSTFQPGFEFQDATEFASQCGTQLHVLHIDVLASHDVVKNPKNRCYYCKKAIFSAIQDEALRAHHPVILEGTNASDDIADRPGFRALQELGILSPLRECGLTKADIREQSKHAGIPLWNKPSYACLATRIRTDETITLEKLQITEHCEAFLASLGFSNFRIRMHDHQACIQIIHSQFPLFELHKKRILDELNPYYSKIELDPTPRSDS